ncbi:hypothetical protein [Veillonella magna]
MWKFFLAAGVTNTSVVTTVEFKELTFGATGAAAIGFSCYYSRI